VTTEAAYKSVALESTGCYLKVLDTAAKYARVRGYETMSSLTVGAGPFPTDTQKSGGAYWIKSNVADSAARPWVLVADDRSLYLLTRWHSSYPAYGGLHFFGDLVPVKPGDAWACAVSGNAADTSASSPGILDDYPHMSLLPSQLYLARPHTGIGSSVAARKGFSVPLFDNAQMTFASGAGPMRYPNGPDQGLYLSEHFVFEALEASLRGVSPGLYCSPQSMPDGWAEPHYSISSVALLPGRLVKVEPYGGNGSPLTGYAFFDVTGPWR
jgi:hypothetical protein